MGGRHVVFLAVLLAGCTSLEKQQSNEQAQVEIVRVQREALARESASEAQARAALYNSLASIVAASPESADAAVLAIAMVGQDSSSDGSEAPLVTLARQQNDAIELTKALAPTIGGVITNVGMAALNASVSKASIRQQAAVSINDSNNDAQIVASVSELGQRAVASVGDNYVVNDSAQLITGTFTANTDSYNTNETYQTSEITDAYNQTDNSATDNSVTDNSVTDNTDNSVITYGGQQMTVRELVEFLQSTGEPYAVRIGESTYTDSDQSDDEQSCVPTFDGYVCS